jgi:branched-chain amino acid transport system ATP-binding protein
MNNITNITNTNTNTNTSNNNLLVDKLNAFYGRAQILFDVGLTVAPGEVVALMGRNGAGKTTTMKAIMGLLEKREGKIEFAGHNIINESTYKISRLGLGYVPEDRRIFTDLTVMENLEVARRPPAKGVVPTFTLERLFELFPNLAAMPHRLGGSMSGGEQQMLTVARTLMGNPSLVLLDEPSEGVAPIIVENMIDAVLALKKAGIGVLLSEQNVPFAAEVADRAYVLEKGQVKFAGDFNELMANESLRRQYLTI